MQDLMECNTITCYTRLYNDIPYFAVQYLYLTILQGKLGNSTIRSRSRRAGAVKIIMSSPRPLNAYTRFFK